MVTYWHDFQKFFSAHPAAIIIVSAITSVALVAYGYYTLCRHRDEIDL